MSFGILDCGSFSPGFSGRTRAVRIALGGFSGLLLLKDFVSELIDEKHSIVTWEPTAAAEEVLPFPDLVLYMILLWSTHVRCSFYHIVSHCG
mmetsp:Transcript_33796/g.70260  ORF Transcript_33796/g.70260 Transcript_33796/m.70260 type:complete len:92 (-) Transcript_33796:680-955(-)